MRPDQRIQLSQAGQQRRDAMLGELMHAMDAHHRRRHRIRRTMSVCGALLLIAGAAAYIISAAGANTPPTHATLAVNTQKSLATEPAAAVLIARIETDPTVLDRYRTKATRDATILSDTELLESLREINRPAGLVRMDGEAWLTASVVDDPAYDAIRPNSL